MATLILAAETQTPVAGFAGDTCELRIYAQPSFYSAEGVPVTGSQTGSQTYYQSYDCTITDGLIRIPQVSLATTWDSSVPQATYTAVFYSADGTQQNTKLGQFFVDPAFFQVQPFSSVEVTVCGTVAARGIYTYRGQSNGKPYYNLVSFADSTTLSAIVWTGSQWRVLGSAGGNLYSSTQDTDYPWQVTAWTVNSGSSPAPAVEEHATLLTSTWEALTISNQGVATIPPQWWGNSPYWSAAQTKQYVDNVAGQNVPYASKLLAGKTGLSTDPEISTQPIALGINDPDWLAIQEFAPYIPVFTNVKYLAVDYNNDYRAAVIAIGSTPTQLIISEPSDPITHDIVTPSTLLHTFIDKGALTGSDGSKTVTIGLMSPAPNKQIFKGDLNVLLDKNAVPVFNLSWWAGPESSGDDQHAFDQVFGTHELYQGGTCLIGAGTWYVDDFLQVNSMVWNGQGNSVDGAATIILKRTLDAPGAALVISDNYRDVVFNDITFSMGNSTTSGVHAVLISGSIPNSGINAAFNNCTFIGSGNGCVPLRIEDADGAHGWEAIGVYFDHCQFSCGVNGKNWSIDTVNSTVYFNQCQKNTPIGATTNYCEYTGWVTDVLPDNRGVNASPRFDFTVIRTITGSILLDDTTLTADTGGFSLDDLGQRVVITGDLDAQIVEVVDATHAIVSTPATGTASGATLRVYRYTPSPLQAKAVWEVVHGHNTINVLTNTEEGYRYFLINSASDNLSPFNVYGGIIQSNIQLDAAMVLNISGCRVPSQLLSDGAAVLATIFTSNNSISKTSVYGCTLSQTRWWNVQNGASMIHNEFDFREGGTTQPINWPTQFLRKNVYGITAIDEPLVAIGAADITSGGPHRSLLRLGRLNNITEEFDLYYDIARDYDTGFLLFSGNQDFPYRGYQFNGSVYGQTFVGETITPSQIVSDDANYIPGGSAQFFRLSTDAPHTLSGLGLSGTSLLSALDGECHEIWNVGAHPLTLLNQNSGSVTVNRFLTDSGQNVTIYPNERCSLVYDGQVSRWRVSKYNITGVTSDGTMVDITPPVTMEDTLDVTEETTLGNGYDFQFNIQPSSVNTGVATLGNLGTDFIKVDEAMDLITVNAATVEVAGRLSTNNNYVLSGVDNYIATTVTYNNTASLANTNLNITLLVSGIYTVNVVIYSTNAVKSLNLDFGGTAVATSFIGEWSSVATDGTTGQHGAKVTSPGTDYSNSGLDTLDGVYRFTGTINVGTGGSLIVRGAQRTADASNTTILALSTITAVRMN